MFPFAALLIIGFLPSSSVTNPIGPALLKDRAVQQCFASMLAATRFGATGEEIGAFLVVETDGTRRCQRWPTKGMRRVEWRGPIPTGTVAIVHTHPAAAPLPSRHDRDAARNAGLPFIVIAPCQVTAAMADGASMDLAGPGWIKRNEQSK